MDEQIKLYLSKSVKTLNQNFVLVVVLSLTSILILTSDISIFLFLAGIIITPVIYGRFFEIPWSNNYSTFLKLFKQHWLNYWIVTLILGTPVFVFGGLLSGFAGFMFKSFLEALTIILGIYAIPLVFITEETVFPIQSGLRCLWQNLQYSLPLILLTVLIVIIKKLSLIFVFRSFQENYTAMFAVAFIHNIILSYISLSVFMTAVMLLLNKPDFQKYLNLKPNVKHQSQPEAHKVKSPNQKPESHLAIESGFKRSIWWKIYFFFITILSAVGMKSYFADPGVGISEYLGLAILLVTTIGLFGFVFLKPIYKPEFWLQVLIANVAFTIIYYFITNVDLRMGMSDTEFYIIQTISLLLSLPGCYGLYAYSKPSNPPWNMLNKANKGER